MPLNPKNQIDLLVAIQSTVPRGFHLRYIKAQSQHAPSLARHQEQAMSRGSLACTRSMTGNPRRYSVIARVDATVSIQMNGRG